MAGKLVARFQVDPLLLVVVPHTLLFAHGWQDCCASGTSMFLAES